MIYHVAPKNQGQIIEVAFAATGDGRVLRRITDRSDRTVRYAIADMHRDDAGDYWQTVPRNRRWRPISAGDAAWIGDDRGVR